MPPTIKRGATTLSRTTFSTKGLFVTHNITTLCYYAERHYAECHILLIVMVNVVMLNVIMLSVVMLNVIMLSVVILNVINNAVR